ncbi:hypothetical protein KC367_g8969 [Hortaea werneckii]|nr:hypothetical protein KC367_g8969 [Hortaea werneckii]
MASPFNLRATQSHSDEMEDAVLGVSDFEQFTEDGSQDMSGVLHFWSDRRLLQDYLATDIAITTTIASPVGSLDWHLSLRTAQFPTQLS